MTGEPPTFPDAPAPRSARTADGRVVDRAELGFAAEVSRLPARLRLPGRLDGFMAWRLYALLRGAWRLLRRGRSR